MTEKALLNKEWMGKDSKGEDVFEGDKVMVIKEENTRARRPEFDFCSVGKEGVAAEYYSSTMVTVEFPGSEKTWGCHFENLLKI